MLPTCPDLHRHAQQLGVRLVRHTGGAKGYYHHKTRTISTRRGMSIAQYRSTLAHELGHAVYNDQKPDMTTSTNAKRNAPTGSPQNSSSTTTN